MLTTHIFEVFIISDSNTDAAAGFIAACEESPDQISIADLKRWYLHLFPNRFSSVLKREGAQKWLEMSRFHHLEDEEILECLQAKSKLQRGFRFDVNTSFLVLQIPPKSVYHNADTIVELRKNLAEISVKPGHYQINDHWFLYIFLKSPRPSAEYSTLLSQWCKAQGYVVDDETLIVHPSEAAIPFPVQEGFIWLNERAQLLIRRNELSLEDSLIYFLQEAGKAAVDPDEFIAALIRSGITVDDGSTAEKIDFTPASSEEDAAETISNIDVESVGATPCVAQPEEPTPFNNVIEMSKHRLGDDLVAVYGTIKSVDFEQSAPAENDDSSEITPPEEIEPSCETELSNETDHSSNSESTTCLEPVDSLAPSDGSKLVVFESNEESEPESSILRKIKDSQLLLFPMQPREFSIEDPIELHPQPRKRRDRVRPTDLIPQLFQADFPPFPEE